MRAKLIYEKFEENSDPIKDMGIGKIDFDEAWREIMSPAEMEWDQYVSQFVDKTISGTFSIVYYPGIQGTYSRTPYAIQGVNIHHSGVYKKFKIVDYEADIITGKIIFKGDDGNKYTTIPEETYIVE